MSDPMMGMPTAPTPKPNAISQNMSMLNPSDAAMMGQSGKITKETTIEQFITGTLKLPLTAPITSLVGALKTQLANRNMSGKAQAMSAQQPAAQGPAAPAVNPQRPPVAPPAPSGDRMGQMMNAMKGGR